MKDYKYVDYLWDDQKAAELNENQLEPTKFMKINELQRKLMKFHENE